jgi:hypothetical protein
VDKARGLKLGGPYKGKVDQHNDVSSSALGTDRVHGILFSKVTTIVASTKQFTLSFLLGWGNKPSSLEISADSAFSCEAV